MEVVFKKISLETLIICYFVGIHHSNCLSNILTRKNGERGARGGNLDQALSGNIIENSSMRKHGLGVKVKG
jgi:hypothetical protein